MAVSGGAVWEVRTTGSDSNGGGFVAGGGGTDLSLSDTAAYGASNLTVDASVNTRVSSAAHTFVSADVGNIMQITAGAGFTTGFYEIQSITAGAANLDRSPAAVSTSGGTYAVGGALATPGKAGQAFVAGNTIWVKTGTYSITSATANIAGGCVNMTSQISTSFLGKLTGYGSTRGDGGRPTLQASGAISTFTIITTNVANTISYIIVDGALKTASRGMNATNGRVYNCKAVNCTNYGITGGVQYFNEATGCSGSNTYGILAQFAFGCWSHDNVSSCNGFGSPGANSEAVNCIASGNNGVGFSDTLLAARYVNCTAYGNNSHGFSLTANAGIACVDLINCVSYGNTGWGINSGLNVANFASKVFLGSNTAGAVTGGATVLSQVNLTANPFVNAAGGDFSLNNAAGGGALVRGSGLPGTGFPGGLTASYPDGGGSQHLEAAAPPFPPASKVYAGVDRGDGVIGTLHASNIATAVGSGSNLTAAVLLAGITVDDVVGALTLPPASRVYAGVNRGDGVTGTLHASNIATAAGSGSNLVAGDLRSGVTVDDVTGTLAPVGAGGGGSYAFIG